MSQHVTETPGELGLTTEANEGQEIFSEVEGTKWARFPVKTRLVVIGDKLEPFLEEFAKPYYKEGDILCIASKVISITNGFYVKESDIKITWFARFLTKFVKKWEHDPGFRLPQKIQLSMDIVGLPRFLLAIVGGGIMKLLGKPGYFYIIAGHNIGAIDGFVPEMYPKPLRGYGFLAPEDPDGICNDIENKFQMNVAILDGNNVDQIVLGMSDGLKARFTKEKLLKILSGNPQGQSGNTPILIVRPEN
jgi:hypothetical protein